MIFISSKYLVRVSVNAGYCYVCRMRMLNRTKWLDVIFIRVKYTRTVKWIKLFVVWSYAFSRRQQLLEPTKQQWYKMNEFAVWCVLDENINKIAALSNVMLYPCEAPSKIVRLAMFSVWQLYFVFKQNALCLFVSI